MRKYFINEYVSDDGQCPFRDWLLGLNNPVRARIQARIFRFESGNLGDYKSIGQGVFEARFDFGPGYRIYFGISRQQIVLLLIGGDKKSQDKDIKKAKAYLKDWISEGE